MPSCFADACVSAEQIYLTELRLSKLDRLSYVVLSSCNRLDNLSSLTELPNLQFLRLRNCNRLTDLSNLAEMKGLQQVVVTRCQGLEPQALKKLREQLPDCRFIVE